MIAFVRRRRSLLIAAALCLMAVATIAILLQPTTTLQGVNYKVTAHRIPVYVKAIDFLQRHFQYEMQASQICESKSSAVDCVLAIFDWTHANIRPTPDGWTIVDDHPLNIITRGYGKSDQMADVFALLTVYAGVPAFFNFIVEPGHQGALPLAFVHLGGEWVPFDVEHQIVFRDRNGNLGGVDELIADPTWVDAVAGNVRPFGRPYSAFISKAALSPFVVPQPLRSQLQQPWPRIRYELRRLMGLGA